MREKPEGYHRFLGFLRKDPLHFLRSVVPQPQKIRVPHVLLGSYIPPVFGYQVCQTHMAVVQNKWYHFGVRCTIHFSLFYWGSGCSLGVRDFDPWPYNMCCGNTGVSQSFGPRQVVRFKGCPQVDQLRLATYQVQRANCGIWRLEFPK